MNETPPVVFVDLLYTPKPDGYEGRWQPWRAMVLNGRNFEPMFMSTEAWTNKQDAIDTIEEAFGPGTNVYLREAEHGNRMLRAAQPVGSFLCSDGTDNHPWVDTDTGAKKCTACGLGMIESSEPDPAVEQ